MTDARLMAACATLALFTAALPAQLTWHAAGAQPGPRAGHYAFFDLARGRTTVFGGQNTPTSYASDCWQLDDRDWVQIPSQTLAPRAHGAACEDPLGGVGLIFGGRDNTTGGLFSETLRWNRELARFDVLAPATAPPPRWVTAMAYDSARHRVVLFGGGHSLGAFGDTWEWDGANWQQQFPAQNPPARTNHTMAYDAARSRVVLYGGYYAASLGDTWTYDGATWTNVSPGYSPARVHNAMLAYDANRNLTALFGGKDDSGTVNNALWEWNGTSWSVALTLTPWPAARELGSLTYDKQRRRITLVGGLGQGGTLLQDAWTWDGIHWRRSCRPDERPSSNPRRALPRSWPTAT